MAKNNVIVISLSVVGKPSAGGVGIGKSSLCNRLMMRDVDNFTPDKHKSTISQTDFVSPVINQETPNGNKECDHKDGSLSIWLNFEDRQEKRYKKRLGTKFEFFKLYIFSYAVAQLLPIGIVSWII